MCIRRYNTNNSDHNDKKLQYRSVNLHHHCPVHNYTVANTNVLACDFITPARKARYQNQRGSCKSNFHVMVTQLVKKGKCLYRCRIFEMINGQNVVKRLREKVSTFAIKVGDCVNV